MLPKHPAFSFREGIVFFEQVHVEDEVKDEDEVKVEDEDEDEVKGVWG
jgi:hypothetical protein